MDSENAIMVQIADHAWTREALHSACILARQRPAIIALVKMIPVQHLGWLGTDLGYLNLSEKDYREIADCEATIEDYGVPFRTELFQYATLDDAILQFAEHVNAQVVFATLPKSIIPFWRSYQLRGLRRHLARHQRKLIQHPVDPHATSPLEEEAAAEA
jgi:hypothetical protein